MWSEFLSGATAGGLLGVLVWLVRVQRSLNELDRLHGEVFGANAFAKLALERTYEQHDALQRHGIQVRSYPSTTPASTTTTVPTEPSPGPSGDCEGRP